jgi:putative colanic acid biosynthesis acetyltransferase WcaF
MLTNPEGAEFAPYPAWTYPARALWVLVQSTLWRLAWRRIFVLRPALLRLFGARVAWRTQLPGSLRIHFPWRLSVAAGTSVGPGVTFYNLGGLAIGSRVVISQNAYVCGGTHDYTVPTYPLVCKPVTIEDDVWIGAFAFLCPGVRVGQGAVVGACAVVTKDVAPWTVVAGNPARVIRARVMQNAGAP